MSASENTDNISLAWKLMYLHTLVCSRRENADTGTGVVIKEVAYQLHYHQIIWPNKNKENQAYIVNSE